MRTTHKAELGLGIGILPDYGIVSLNALELGIVDNVFLSTLDYKLAAELNGLGGEVFDVVKSDSSVRCGRRAEILEIGASGIVKLCAKPLIEPMISMIPEFLLQRAPSTEFA